MRGLRGRLDRLEKQVGTNQFNSVDVTKMSNRELSEYIKELEKERITIGSYRNVRLGDLSNEEIKFLLGMSY